MQSTSFSFLFTIPFFDISSLQDLIGMIVSLKDSVEKQAKKQSDLEDYIDSLLMKVIQQAPDILQKNAIMEKKYASFIK